jgi:hypothetical protein
MTAFVSALRRDDPWTGSNVPSARRERPLAVQAIARNMGASVQMLDFTGTPQIEQWQLTLRRNKGKQKKALLWEWGNIVSNDEAA